MALALVAFANAGLHGNQPGIANVAAITLNEVILVQQFLKDLERNMLSPVPTVTHAELQAYRIFSVDVHERRSKEGLLLLFSQAGSDPTHDWCSYGCGCACNGTCESIDQSESQPINFYAGSQSILFVCSSVS